MKPERLTIILPLAFLALAALACQIDVGGPARPDTSLPAAGESQEPIEQTWKSAVESMDASGQIIVIVTESQLNGLAQEYLAKQDQVALTDPQIFLQDGQIQFHGVLDQGMLKANLRVGIVPVVEDDGRLAFRIESADLGPVPAPEAVRDTISAALTELLSGSLGPLATGLRITTLAVDNGEMAIIGQLR
jgi:uncharacterized protein YpmS